MRFSHCLLLFALCVSQFLPLAFCFMALPTILLSQGLPLDKISLVYLFGFIWMSKFLWAPMIDKIGFGRLGHYKMWLLLSQTLLVGTVIIFSFVGGTENNTDNFYMLLVFGLLMSVFASTQDIAADAIACRLIPENQRGLGSAIQLSGGLLATILGGGAILVLYTYIGWRISLWTIAFLVACVIPLIFRFNEQDIQLDQNIIASTSGFSRLVSFWFQPGAGIWAMILIILPASITVAWALAPPILIDRGWTPDEIGILLHVIAPVTGVAFSVVIGYFLNKYGKWPVISMVPILQLVALLALLMVLDKQFNASFITVALVIVYIMDVGLFLILNAFKLEYSSGGTEGADFTVQESLHGFAVFGIAAATVYFAEIAGFERLIVGALILTLLSGGLLYFVILNNSLEGRLGSNKPA